jgi:transposase InsO family protein
MSLRRVIVEVDTDTVNVAGFCREHGISTWFFWDLRRRFAVDGDAALVPRSRAPKRVANKTPVEIEDAIVAKRKELVDASLECGPATIAWHLRDLQGVPSESTIWRVLKARGFINDDPSKAPKSAGRRFQMDRANESWQLDDTGWDLADGTGAKILNIVDDHSRLLPNSVAMEACTGEQALGAFLDAGAEFGLPERFQSDNAKTFREVLARALAELGIASVHSRPLHPQTNGKVERFHQTLKKHLRGLPRAATIEQLQAQLDHFRHIYNHERPHRSIGRRTPAQAWLDAPKSGPADRPLTAATTITRSIVAGGMAKAANRYQITIGATHNGTEATAVLTGTTCHIFINGRLVRALTIDPTRTHQPLHNRPGRPTRLP